MGNIWYTFCQLKVRGEKAEEYRWLLDRDCRTWDHAKMPNLRIARKHIAVIPAYYRKLSCLYICGLLDSVVYDDMFVTVQSSDRTQRAAVCCTLPLYAKSF